MQSFQKRLVAVQRAGNLTTSDLARWFDRPHSTLRAWIEEGKQPGGGPIDKEHAQALLGLLETLVKQKKGFPVPRLSPRKRIEHIQHIRDKFLP